MRQTRHLSAPDSVAQSKAFLPGLPGGTGLGKYRILERIRTCHNAIVYKARDAMLDRLVAIKQMSPGLIDNPVACGYFKREAQLLARIPPDARHVVNIHELIEIDVGLFIVEEYVDGRWLESLISKRQVGHAEAPRLLKAAALGLRTLHSHMIVHRDINPGNIIVSGKSTARIANLASAAHEGDLSPPPVITPRYAAPELLADQVYDDRVDIYALGLVIYELSVGRPALEKHLAAALSSDDPIVSRWVAWQLDPAAHLPDATDLNPLVSRELSSILRRMIAKNPDDRYAGIVELLDDLAVMTASQRALPDRWQGMRPAYLPDSSDARRRKPLLPGSVGAERPSVLDAEYESRRPQLPTSTHTVRSRQPRAVDPAWAFPKKFDALRPDAATQRNVSRRRSARRHPVGTLTPHHAKVAAIPAPPPPDHEVHRKRPPHVVAWTLAFLVMAGAAATGGSYLWYYNFGPGFHHPIETAFQDAWAAYDQGEFDLAESKLLEVQNAPVTRARLVAVQSRVPFWRDLIRAQNALSEDRYDDAEDILKNCRRLGLDPSRVEDLQQRIWLRKDAYRLASEGLEELARGEIPKVELKLDEYAEKAAASGLDPNRLQTKMDETRRRAKYREALEGTVEALARSDYLEAFASLRAAEAVQVSSATRELRTRLQNAQDRNDWIIRGDHSMARRDYGDAEECYLRANQLEPTQDIERKARAARAYGLFEASRALIEKGALLEAEKKLKSSLWNLVTPEAQKKLEKMQPAFEAARMARNGDRAAERDQFSEAERFYQEALPRLPEPMRSEVRLKMSRMERKSLIFRGDENMKAGRYQAALAAYEKARSFGNGRELDDKIRRTREMLRTDESGQ